MSLTAPSAPLRAALGREMLAAATVVRQVVDGQSLTAALAQVDITAASQSVVAEISYWCLRNLGMARSLQRILVERAPTPALAALLWVGLAQLIEGRRPAPIIVHQLVDAVRHEPQIQRQAGFVNAVLRRFVRDRDALIGQLASDVEAQTNHPSWWVEQLRQDWPEQWRSVLALAQQPAWLTLRVNPRRADIGQLAMTLTQAGYPTQRLSQQALLLAESGIDVRRLPGFDAGHFSVQDYGAQLAAPLLAPVAGERILDACAAPGGKTTHLLELADCEVTAVDSDAERAERIEQNLNRLGLAARVVVADVLQTDSWSDGRLFDRILLDAPCTASGIVRRHPDIRWHRQRRDLTTNSRLQRQLIVTLWSQLKPGGKMLYATCSLFRAENEAVIGEFLRQTPQARRVPLVWQFPTDRAGDDPGQSPQVIDQLLPTAAGPRVHDGFYYALLEKYS